MENRYYIVLMECVVAALLVGAVWGEYHAITQNTKRAKNIHDVAIAPGATPCDIIASAAQMNAKSAVEQSVTWRRSIIAACTLVTVGPYLLDVQMNIRQRFGLMLLAFLCVTSIESYSNYHFTNVTSIAVDNNLRIAIQTFDSITCDSQYVSFPRLSQSLRPLG